MVKNMGYIDNFTGKVWDWTKPFQRTGKFPLDRSSMFSSYDDALLYAKGDGSDSRGLGATSYIGQIITVWGDNENGVDGVWAYTLVPTEKEGFAAELKAIGSSEEIGAITDRVDALEEYKDTVTSSLDAKANADDLSTLETKVDGDIKNLTDHLSDYSTTLGEVDGRLGELEAFVEAHESIQESDIEGLFSESN
jgi:hypothetical protein